MNWDQVQGKWKQARGSAKLRWGKLTDDDMDVIAGRKDILIGKLQERYGWAKEQAEVQSDEWMRSMHDDEEPRKHFST